MSETSANLCRWGIMSTAGIARKNWHAIHNSENATIVAVASRHSAKAEDFIEECNRQVTFDQIPEAVEGYDALLARTDIDAVYVPLPTGLRKGWVIKAAQAGKHVMCEKPCAINAADLQEMVDACAANGVQFMDGVMFMHSKRMPALRAVLDDEKSVGTIRRIASHFSFRAPDDFLAGDIRLNSETEPMGALGDLGWYTSRITLFAMNYEMPTSLRARMISSSGQPGSPEQVPTQISAELVFPSGATASFYNSFMTEHQQWVNISGTEGHVTINDFVLPYCGNELELTVANAHFEIDNCNFVMERHDRQVRVAEYANNHPSAQETNLFRNFSQLVLSGKPDPHWPDIAVKTQRILDACLESARNDGKEVQIG